MQLIKSIDAGATYKTLDNYWWINNDTLPSKWAKSNISVSAVAWKAFFEKYFIAFSNDYRRKDADNPFNIASTTGYHNVHKQKIAIQVDINSEIGDIISISVDIVFELLKI